ncbi:MAG: 4-hydroxythreonine-4-phosphate dehydrogenase PdxA [Polyangiaceae bacterium]|nr:4-hydroxythreonine-4-phosphate dehydrogenase PdxA [Polyangiaceae bacterium]
MKNPILAMSLGCPAGVGPVVAVRAAARAHEHRCVLVGDPAVVAKAIAASDLDVGFSTVASREEVEALPTGTLAVYAKSAELGARLVPGKPDAPAGSAQLSWIDQALELVTRGFADALVTGPVSKHAIATSGARGSATFLGHTEHLAHKLRSKEVVMAFWSPELTTALVTTHLPLAAVPKAIRPRDVAMATYWLARLLAALGSRSPRVAVASLNPHAGEGGLLGNEETKKIAPGIELARERLRDERRSARIEGPVGAETAFRRAIQREGARYDGVVAMYHDQATIPMKLLAFGDAVNVTLGLPIIRTSVDHGTGYDIAWKKSADAAGMIEAASLAARLVKSGYLNRRARSSLGVVPSFGSSFSPARADARK